MGDSAESAVPQPRNSVLGSRSPFSSPLSRSGPRAQASDPGPLTADQGGNLPSRTTAARSALGERPRPSSAPSGPRVTPSGGV